MTLPPFSALPSIRSATSNSFSLTLLALTLIWILIAGGCCCGASEAGAFGFSNDRSLVYCASTLSWGGGAASGGVPLPLVMGVSPDAFSSQQGPALRLNSLKARKGLCRASGYHSRALSHKDDQPAQLTAIGAACACQPRGSSYQPRGS